MFVGNALTSTALLLCPVIILTLMARRPLEEAVLAALFGSALLLPEKAWVDLPVLPRLDKHGIAALSIYVGLLIFARPRVKVARPLAGTGRLVWLFVIGAFGTAMTNRDRLYYGPKVLPELTIHDAIAMAIGDVVNFGLPFIVGKCVFRDPRAMRLLFSTLLSWAMMYTILALIEVRISPQLHRMVWGYMQHSFVQVKRAGGFRPMVFMEHGLAVAIFFAVAIIFAVGARNIVQRTWRMSTMGAAAYLYVVLILCKSTGALAFATLGGLILRFTSSRTAVRISALLALLVFSYPMLRSNGYIPTEKMVEWARSMTNDERAESLEFRFDNEDQLLERVLQRPMFGWGGFARQRVYNDAGRDLTVLDGHWIILMGVSGWVGFIAAFGLIIFPIFKTWRRFNTLSVPSDRALVATLTVALAFSATDLLPNGLFNRLPYYMAGALLGLLEGIPEARKRQQTQ